MTQSKIYLYSVITFAIAAMLIAMAYQARDTEASVQQTHEYMATTTSASLIYGNTTTGDKTIKRGPGALGSVIITGANTGVFNIYNATTTNKFKRTGQPASSTILIAQFPASVAAGTYTFDVAFSSGLLVDVISGNIATSTITYR